MQKAHLIEALYLVNQGTEKAVRGLVRLKKAPGSGETVYGGVLAKLEQARAQVNLQFFADTEAGEQKDAVRFDSLELAKSAAHTPERIGRRRRVEG
jgi:hypothetical protein